MYLHDFADKGLWSPAAALLARALGHPSYLNPPTAELPRAIHAGTYFKELSLLQYVYDFRSRIAKACDLAKSNLKEAQGKMKALCQQP